MRDRATGDTTTGVRLTGEASSPGSSWSRLLLAGAALAFLFAAVLVRLTAGSGFDWLQVCAALAALGALGALFAMEMLSGKARSAPARGAANADHLKNVLESAGPMIFLAGLDARFTYANPAAERQLGYHAAEILAMPNAAALLAPDQGERLIKEMLKLSNAPEPAPESTNERLAAYMDCIRSMSPSKVPSFNTQLRRKDGSIVPVALHISALRNGQGEFSGLVAVALDQSATVRQEQVLRESQERYRDLFENSSEMIATLSPKGRFLYANPAWKRAFGLDHTKLLGLESFEEIFGVECRAEVSALFHRALAGTMVDRAPLRNHTADGRTQELELSLSQRQKAGNPLAVRCLLRDVTQQRQRENRLTLQLVVGQIAGENLPPEIAARRMLEALCISQGWDLAFQWQVNGEENRLEFATAWAASGRRAEGLLQQSMGVRFPPGAGLPGKAWESGRALWIPELAATSDSPRSQTAMQHEMASGWAVPVRAGNCVLAVLEFYSHHLLREHHEAMAAIETVASSLGQMLERNLERGRAEELSRQQEILLNSVADGILGVDRYGVVSFANPAAARLLGAAASVLTGKPVHDILHGEGENRTCAENCTLKLAAENRLSSSGEESLQRVEGTSFQAEYFLTPILEHGRFSGSVLSFRDISQRYALDRMKDEFISTVSHELRTPLTSIRGALGLLTSGILGNISDKATNMLRIASANSDRLVRLINDILDLERIQSGREPLNFRKSLLAELVRQAIDDMEPMAQAAGVRLIHDSTEVEVSADPDRLSQVLTNLLSNAIKFSPPESTISVILRPGTNGVTLSVIDQGRGIPADKLESIFGRFQQVDVSDSRQKGGSGLGLAICRTIVLQHSGRIWAERNPVRGSTFRVFLPYRPADNTAPVNGDTSLYHGTVVLADANSATRPATAALLARHGYRVVEAATVEQTLTAAHAGAAAILLDTSLAGMNGWQILPLLRQCNPEARTPIVLLCLSGQQTVEDLPALAEGRVDKPLQEEKLLGELARVLSVPGEKARVLVVEDDLDLAAIIGEVFSRDSIEVKLAYSRREALDACFSFEPNLLVLDIGLPDGDGFNVVDWLRQHESLSALPLVVYSGRELTGAERRQLTLGPTHFLSKARVEPQQLEALVLTMLRTSMQAEEPLTALSN